MPRLLREYEVRTFTLFSRQLERLRRRLGISAQPNHLISRFFMAKTSRAGTIGYTSLSFRNVCGRLLSWNTKGGSGPDFSLYVACVGHFSFYPIHSLNLSVRSYFIEVFVLRLVGKDDVLTLPSLSGYLKRLRESLRRTQPYRFLVPECDKV